MRARVVLAAVVAGVLGACSSSDTGPGDPPALAIVNRSNLAYAFGVVIFTSPTQGTADTLFHSNGNDSVCTQIPAAGDDYETLYGVPVDTTDKPINTQVFIGGAANGWLLTYGPKAVGNDTLVLTLSPSVPC